jgi:A/G-specific adenine glycosylase
MPRVNKNNITELQRKLLEWYKSNGRKFPWRKSGLSNYQLVIVETLLQRTKAETISNFFLKFVTEFPSWKSLANAETTIIEDYLRPIGLYRQRAKRLQSLANEMVKRNGVLPKDRKELESIPFLGQYIANAIELIIFNMPSPLIDVNMSRVLERYFGNRQMADIRYDPYLQKLSYAVVNHPNAKELNWAILDFAALVCKASKPLCLVCPLQKKCNYYQSN